MVSTPKHDDKMPIQSQPQNKNAGVAKEITVKLDDHSEVSVTITVEAFELSSLDAWIRSRFGLPQVMKLRYLTEKGKEFIPDKLYIHSNDVVNVKSVKEIAKAEPPVDMTFAHSFMALTVALTVAALLLDHPIVKGIVDIRLYCSHIDQILIDFGLVGKAGVTLDAYIATVCWGFTYLYIRRLWNPETMSVAIQRFSADSFFGGLASGGAILLKAIILHFMSKY